MEGDEAYAGSRSFVKLQVRHLPRRGRVQQYGIHDWSTAMHGCCAPARPLDHGCCCSVRWCRRRSGGCPGTSMCCPPTRSVLGLPSASVVQEPRLETLSASRLKPPPSWPHGVCLWSCLGPRRRADPVPGAGEAGQGEEEGGGQGPRGEGRPPKGCRGMQPSRRHLITFDDHGQAG